MKRLQRIVALSIAILSLPFAVPASPRFVTGPLHLAGRTVANMATFKDKKLALAEWLNVAAVITDAVVSEQALQRNRFAVETSPLMPRRPSAGIYAAEMGPLAFFEVMTDQYTQEQLQNDPNKYWRFAGRAVMPSFWTAYHMVGIVDSLNVKAQTPTPSPAPRPQPRPRKPVPPPLPPPIRTPVVTPPVTPPVDHDTDRDREREDHNDKDRDLK